MVDVFLWVIGVLLAFQLLLLLGLIVWKTRTLSNEKAIGTEVEQLMPQYKEYIEGSRSEQPKLPGNVKLKVVVIERILY